MTPYYEYNVGKQGFFFFKNACQKCSHWDMIQTRAVYQDWEKVQYSTKVQKIIKVYIISLTTYKQYHYITHHFYKDFINVLIHSSMQKA